jgi:hypothetical protein
VLIIQKYKRLKIMNWRPKSRPKGKTRVEWKRPKVMAEVKKGLWRLKWASDWFGAWLIGRERLFRAQRLRRAGDNFLRRTNDKGTEDSKSER